MSIPNETVRYCINIKNLCLQCLQSVCSAVVATAKSLRIPLTVSGKVKDKSVPHFQVASLVKDASIQHLDFYDLNPWSITIDIMSNR